jgi:hypothetical protein
MSDELNVGDIRKALDEWEAWIKKIRDTVQGKADHETLKKDQLADSPIAFQNPILADNCDQM